MWNLSYRDVENLNAIYYGVKLRSYIFVWFVSVFCHLAWAEMLGNICGQYHSSLTFNASYLKNPTENTVNRKDVIPISKPPCCYRKFNKLYFCVEVNQQRANGTWSIFRHVTRTCWKGEGFSSTRRGIYEAKVNLVPCFNYSLSIPSDDWMILGKPLVWGMHVASTFPVLNNVNPDRVDLEWFLHPSWHIKPTPDIQLFLVKKKCGLYFWCLHLIDPIG